MSKPSIRETDESTLTAWLKSHNQPAFRAKQIRDWFFSKMAVSFDDMANVPKALREELAQDFTPCSLTPSTVLRADDGTVKWASELSDGAKVETVLIRAPERSTVCISTQVGCPVRCAFCESGRLGLVRNLKSVEIIDQVIIASHELGHRIDNVVVMGTGEPMFNLDNLIPALNYLCDMENGLGISARNITVSTSGIPNGIRRLADQHRPWNLALSLHAPNDKIRSQLIPEKNRHRIAEILAACTEYREATGRMITFEYVLIDGMNASEGNARDLARLAHLARAKVNLIPLNNGSTTWKAPSKEQCQQFLDILTASGLQATIRLRKGDKIKAACGQLVAKKSPEKPDTPPNEAKPPRRDKK
ncbi:MAG: 23S rRNA (adenine(2503)-C(2))-methyltransferase RlmN [Victivallales bacterium]|nr:23S rRNA (adenine(2503)-C(2))-methyltransferase RlmN [Victivallales bacterium]